MTEVFRAEPYVRIVERSPGLLLAPRAAPRRMALILLAGLGSGREVTAPVWDLVLRLRTTQVLVVITADERESLDTAAALLSERFKLPARAG